MIVPVKKVKIFTLEENKTDLLLALQQSELMMFTDKVDSSTLNTKIEDDLIQRANSVLSQLSKYQGKKGMFDFHEMSFTDFTNENNLRIDLLEDLESGLNRHTELKKQNEDLVNLKEQLVPFEKMPYVTNDLQKSLYVSFHIGFIPVKKLEETKEYFKEMKIEYEIYDEDKKGVPLIFVLDKDEQEEQLLNISSLGFTQAELPLSKNKVAVEIKNINETIQQNILEIEKLEKEFSNSKEQENEIKTLIDQLNAKKDRLAVPILSTEKTIYVDGWVREDKIEDLRKIVGSITDSFDLDIRDPRDDEEDVPTALQNNKFVHQFETVTNMFSAPNHKEVDPNPVMSIWYWIIFGIMMGDIGYGLAMILVFGLFIKLKRPKGSFSQLIHVLFYSGFTSIAAGIVFGSVFGFDVNIIGFVGKIFGQNWNSFSVMNDPLTMLIFSIGLGVVHIVSALILKVILSFKQKDPLTALADGFSWIFILLGGTATVIGMVVLKSNFLKFFGLAFVGIGLLLILTLAGRNKKGVMGKVTSGLGGLYSITGYLSDLLSYSRILALSLSSAVIASTMNLLAGLVQGSFIGIIFSILIYIVGHIFNLAMGLLSAYVHDSRLQYIEFFNKFYEGGGIEFQPLKFDTKHINEITNNWEEI